MNKPKKRQLAAALEFDPEKSSAPVLTAFGEGVVAERIIAAANESKVPVVADSNIAEVLKTVTIGDEIPEELYEVVAQVLVFISDVDNKSRPEKNYTAK
ncbi:MAG: EscU/YscU/HrcU family type III secretion system export apparatus switch protein [Oscillospiraceae bacterium]|jgi:flagellar biosynthesis protein|nr:EscU/YscU/HrcU family type III secretion system export apparatus switch protein [Oscillospiraceae bacterium]